MAALEERVLEELATGPLRFDTLRASLDVQPGELDRAIARLEASRQIVRRGGQFVLLDAPAVAAAAPRIAEASPAEPELQKACTKCHQSKPLSEFYANTAMRDGHDSRCKACKKAQVRKSDQKRAGSNDPAPTGPKPRVPPNPPASEPKQPAAATPAPVAETPARASGQVIFLFANDGVVIGALEGGAGGVAQLANHVDLTFAQLDQLCEAWLARKASAEAR